MAEEEKQVSNPEGQAGAAASEQDSQESASSTVEAQYKELQAKVQELQAERDSLQSQYDLLAEYVDWDKVRGITEESQTTETTDPEKKSLEAEIRRLESQIQSKLLVLEFRSQYPDLKDYEESLVAPAILRFRRQFPRENPEKILERAAKFARDFLESERAKGKELAKDKKAEEAAASGLESEGSTSPKEEKPGQTPEEYIAERKRLLEARRRPVSIK